MVNARRSIEELYIIETCDNSINKERAKIGVAIDAMKRFRAIQNTSPVKLYQYRVFIPEELAPLEARTIENHVKRLLSWHDKEAHEHSREWFTMPGHVLEWFVEGAIADIVGNIAKDTKSVRELAAKGKVTLMYRANNGICIYELPSGRLIDEHGNPTTPSEAMKNHPINSWKANYELQEANTN